MQADDRDTELAAAAARGDRAALDELLRRNANMVHAVCRRVLANPDDALDAAQEALIAIARRIDTFDGRAKFTTWCYRVATNAALDEARRRARRPAPVEIVAEPRSDAPALDEAVADQLDIDDALGRLSPEYRAAVALRDLLGLDYADIATILDIPPGTVRSRIARGRAALAAELAAARSPREPNTAFRASKPPSLMNIPEPPLSPELLDELLSAELDGEFDRAAVDLGFEPGAARVAVAASPAAAERRAALVRARDLLATPPALDPARADTLVAAALDATALPRAKPISLHERRSTRVWRTVASVAAAAAVIAGIVAVANTSDNGMKASTSKSSSADLGAGAGDATTGRQNGPQTSLTFGDLSQPGALESRARALLPLSRNRPEAAAAPTVTAPAFSQGSKAAGSADDSANRFAARRGISGCTSAIRKSALLEAPVLSGRGTVDTAPVYVLVFDQGRGRVAYALSVADCSVVRRVSVP